MLICILVIIPLPSREDLGMLYVYEYVLPRDVGSKKPKVLYQAVYHGFSIASHLHCRAHIPIIDVLKVVAR